MWYNRQRVDTHNKRWLSHPAWKNLKGNITHFKNSYKLFLWHKFVHSKFVNMNVALPQHETTEQRHLSVMVSRCGNQSSRICRWMVDWFCRIIKCLFESFHTNEYHLIRTITDLNQKIYPYPQKITCVLSKSPFPSFPIHSQLSWDKLYCFGEVDNVHQLQQSQGIIECIIECWNSVALTELVQEIIKWSYHVYLPYFVFSTKIRTMCKK